MTGGAGQRQRLLILGGTAEARELAALAVEEFRDQLDVTTSLAGRTADPVPVKGHIRRGGFGGASGLAAFLRDEHIDLIIDATHPFATQISRHAVTAAAEVELPHLALLRPAWCAADGDRWIEVSDAAAAAVRLSSLGHRVWLTVGSGELAAFADLPDTWFLIRRVEPPARPIELARHHLILGRGPFALADERRLIAEYRIDALVCRASGGVGSEAKLVAAREAGLPVVMIARPPQSSTLTVESPEAALEWLRARVNS
jgi:precorrin-6A/cobalt-precorrin-6A reductase